MAILLITVLAGGALAPVVSAQEDGAAPPEGTPTPTPTEEPAGTPAGENGTNGSEPGAGADEDEDEDSGGFGGFGGVPDAGDVLESGMQWFYDSLVEGLDALISEFNHIVLTLPAPGEPTEPSTWAATPPEDSWWHAVRFIYVALSGIVLIPLAAMGLHNATKQGANPREKREKGKKALYALVAIAAGWHILAFALHSGNAVSLAFAPTTDEFLATGDGVFRLGLGFVLAILLAYFKVAVILLGLIFLLIQWILVPILVAFWPLLVTFRASESRLLTAAGDAGVSALGALIVIKMVQGIMLRFVFELPMDITNPETIFSVVGTIVLLAIIFIGIPVKGMKILVPQAMSLSGSYVNPQGAADKIAERAPSRQQIIDRVSRGKERAGRNRASPKSATGRRGASTDGGERSPNYSQRRASRNSPRRTAERASRRRTSSSSRDSSRTRRD